MGSKGYKQSIGRKDHINPTKRARLTLMPTGPQTATPPLFAWNHALGKVKHSFEGVQVVCAKN